MDATQVTSACGLPGYPFGYKFHIFSIILKGKNNSFSDNQSLVQADLAECQAWLPDHSVDSHKGSNGRVLVLGGEKSMAGATCLAGWAAYIAGAGLVRVATIPENVSAITSLRPELLVSGINKVQQLKKLLHGDEVLALGHAFLGIGPMRIPMAQAEVISVIPSRISSFKLTNAGPVVGAFDEDRLIHIHPRVDGWLETLHVKAEGDPVEQGQPLYALYSPTLVNAQEEMVLALERNSPRLIDAAEARLRALAVSGGVDVNEGATSSTVMVNPR